MRLKAALLLIILVAVGLRFYRISAESFWFDEVWTYYYSSGSIAKICHDNAEDVHPPLYYLGVYSWRLIFGSSETAIRSYSVFFSLLGLIALYLLIRDIFSKEKALIASLLYAVNPLSIYFAQESRMYAQAATIGIVSSWCLWRWFRCQINEKEKDNYYKWVIIYILSTSALIYSHFVAGMLPLAQGIFILTYLLYKRKFKSAFQYIIAASIVFVLFLPILIYILNLRKTFYHPFLGWIANPEIIDLYSFLGLEFIWGPYSDLHEYFWKISLAFVAGIMIWGAVLDFKNPSSGDSQDSPGIFLKISYLYWLMFGTIFCAFAISMLYHPILFKPRFAMFILPYFLGIISHVCLSIKKKHIGYILILLTTGVMLSGAYLAAHAMQKENWRKVVGELNTIDTSRIMPFLSFNETLSLKYHLKKEFPLLSKNEFIQKLPGLRDSTFYILTDLDFLSQYENKMQSSEKTEYLKWLMSLGSVSRRTIGGIVYLYTISVGKFCPEKFDGKFAKTYRPLDVFGIIEGFSEPTYFSILERDGDENFRWSEQEAYFKICNIDPGKKITLIYELPPKISESYKPNLQIFIIRSDDLFDLLKATPNVVLPEYKGGRIETELIAPQGTGDILVAWKINPVNLNKEGFGKDKRNLGMKLYWVGIN